MVIRFSLPTALTALAFLTACAGPSNSTASGLNPSASLNERVTPKQSSGPTVYAESTSALGEKFVAVFGDGGSSLLREIKNGADVAADSSGYLYIARKPVAIYSDAGKTLVQTFAVKDGPWIGLIAADGLGHFYVLGGPQHDDLYEYQIGKTDPIRELKVAGNFLSITTDTSGNLYLGFGKSVLVYSPDRTSPKRTITKGIDGPVALTVDPQGNVYVANNNFDQKRIHVENITVYRPGAIAPSRKILNRITRPLVLQADSGGNLAVLNGRDNDTSSPPNIAIYLAGSSAPLKVITQGINAPTSIAFDASNNLYVSNHGATYSDPGSITVYRAGSYDLTRTITKDINQPDSVAVGP